MIFSGYSQKYRIDTLTSALRIHDKMKREDSGTSWKIPQLFFNPFLSPSQRIIRGHIRQLSTAPMAILGNNNKQINWM